MRAAERAVNRADDARMKDREFLRDMFRAMEPGCPPDVFERVRQRSLEIGAEANSAAHASSTGPQKSPP